MPSFVPSDAETLRDAERYTQARLTRVKCLDCTAVVGVKKNSVQHTSIQWTDLARANCLTLDTMASTPVGRESHAPCPSLQRSIDHAAERGQIPIGAEDGY